MINIVVMASSGPETFAFLRDEVVVGSAPDADLVLDNPGVAKRHVRIALRDRVLMVEDLAARRHAAEIGVLRMARCLAPTMANRRWDSL